MDQGSERMASEEAEEVAGWTKALTGKRDQKQERALQVYETRDLDAAGDEEEQSGERQNCQSAQGS